MSNDEAKQRAKNYMSLKGALDPNQTTVEHLVKFNQILGKLETTSSQDVLINSNTQAKEKQTAKYIVPNITLYIDGRLYNHNTNKFKKWTKDNNGYMKTQIWVAGKPKNVLQHRLLAQEFIDNPKNKKQVNHKNGVKHDNRIENLEWVTQSENGLHSFANGLQKVTRPCKKVIDINSNKIYESVTEAAKDNMVSRSHLSNMLTGRFNNKTTLKFLFIRKTKL